MLSMTGMKLESLKLPPEVVDTYQEVAKEIGTTRAFLIREVLIDYMEKLKAGKYTRRMKVILDISNNKEDEPEHAYG